MSSAPRRACPDHLFRWVGGCIRCTEGATSRGVDVSTSAVLGAITYYQFITRSLPPGAWSTLTWQGRVFDVMGEVRRSNGSDMTRHDSIVCRAQQPEVLP